MALYRANDRHPADERILVIEDMADFALWRERYQHSINGMVWRYPVDNAVLEQAARQIETAATRAENAAAFSKRRPPHDPSGRGANYLIHANTSYDYFRGRLDGHGIDGPAQNITVALLDVFRDVTDLEAKNLPSTVFMRLNDASISDPHAHGPTLSFTFTQAGTVCYPGNYGDFGAPYTIEAGHALLFDDTIWHNSPDFEEKWKENPRANLAIV